MKNNKNNWLKKAVEMLFVAGIPIASIAICTKVVNTPIEKKVECQFFYEKIPVYVVSIGNEGIGKHYEFLIDGRKEAYSSRGTFISDDFDTITIDNQGYSINGERKK
ncbi:MAG: hypothetical protein AABW50_00745 [Nanoarchaeota archaeon]